MASVPFLSTPSLHSKKVMAGRDVKTAFVRSPAHENLVSAVRSYVKESMAKHDSSHDWWHIERVHRTALSLAEEEGLSQTSKEIVELAAMLHDVEDHKYVGRGSKAKGSVAIFLKEQGCPEDMVSMITTITMRVGFSEEMGGAVKEPVFPELAVVQDADRLDALGAIGIARTLTYGGSRARVLHDPEIRPREGMTMEEYMKKDSTTINHFYEKLLKLKGMMKSDAGRRRAESRHQFMEDFLQRFNDEWDARA